MALVPAANGVESIAAEYGIRITDTGGNRMRIGVDLQTEYSRVTPARVIPWNAGYREYLFGEAFTLDFQGLYLFACAIDIPPLTLTVAGPDDRIVVGIKNITDNVKLAGVPFKIYNQAVDIDVAQTGHGSAIMRGFEGKEYRICVEVFNMSGTLSTPNFIAAAQVIPLSSVQGDNPAPPEVAELEEA